MNLWGQLKKINQECLRQIKKIKKSFQQKDWERIPWTSAVSQTLLALKSS